jgi:molybdate transport system ATP-binding protein
MISVSIEKKIAAYNGLRVLKIHHEFPAGSITKVSGPSGAGKTTLLKMVAGFVQPDSGKIIVNNTVWTDTSARIALPAQKRLAGFVFQDYALFPNMTVLQHLEYAAQDKAWISRLLELGRLQTLAGHKPQYLSGGQQQRLAILRALAIKPKVMLMDEPFSALDGETKSTLISELGAIFRELNATVLIVSHNLAELEGLPGGQLHIQAPD